MHSQKQVKNHSALREMVENPPDAASNLQERRNKSAAAYQKKVLKTLPNLLRNPCITVYHEAFVPGEKTEPKKVLI
jgi:hypothetical protein